MENIEKQVEQLGLTIKTDLEKSNTELKSQIETLQGQFDTLTTKGIELAESKKSFLDEVKSTLSSTNEDILVKGFKFSVKAALTPANGVAPDQHPGIVGYANRKVNARNLIAVGSTSSNAVNYVQEQSYTSFTATTAEGVKRPESAFELVGKIANVKTIGTFLKVSKEMLADVDGITSYIANRAPAKVAEVEDKFIIDTLKVDAQPFSATTIALGTGATVNEYDVLRVGVQMIAKVDYSATAILVNPTDKAKLELAKDSTGAYLFPQGNMSVAGVPIVESNCIAEGDFLVGDWRMGAELKQREGVTINFYNQNGTDIEDGLVTVGIEERVALPVYNPKSFVIGSFTAAKAKLKA